MDKPNILQLDIADTLTDEATDGLALCVFEGENQPSQADIGVQKFIRRTGEMILLDGGFKAEEGDSLLVRAADEAMPGRTRCLLFIGLGPRADYNPATLRRAAGAAIRQAKAAGMKRLQFLLPAIDGDDPKHSAGVVAEGASLGFYENAF